MRIWIATPAPPGSRKGNRVTALRWAAILKSLGHRPRIVQECTGRHGDLLIALHARKSHASVRNWRRRQPERPLIVALTGTDLYGDIQTSRAAQESLELATRLIVLQGMGLSALPEALRSKARVIHQSVERPKRLPSPRRDTFELCVLGHLRPVKDPFRTAMAVRLLPASSRIHISHVGAALSDAMQRRALAEQARNPRYQWLCELPRWKAIQVLARSRLLVLSSKVEGGANVISEALTVGTPVLASRISGSIGLLGEDYPGYFEFGDQQGLARLLCRAETQPRFLRDLATRCKRLAKLFRPTAEKRSWGNLLRELDAL